MRLDMRHALRHAECLANPSALQGARWEQWRVSRTIGSRATNRPAATEGSPCGTGPAVGEAGHEACPAACRMPAESAELRLKEGSVRHGAKRGSSGGFRGPRFARNEQDGHSATKLGYWSWFCSNYPTQATAGLAEQNAARNLANCGVLESRWCLQQ